MLSIYFSQIKWKRTSFATAVYLSIAVASLVGSGTCIAQQNLFNIPSGEITPKGKFFYQHQINFYSASLFESKSHLVYGVGKGWDIGMNLVDMPININQGQVRVTQNDFIGQGPLYPLFMLTAQKQFRLNEAMKFNIGTQVGTNLTNRLENKAVAHFNYLTVQWKYHKRGLLIAGPYVSNQPFIGESSSDVGWIFGYEIPVTKRFALMGDLISGQHKKSVSTFGAIYDLSKRVQICAAALVPFPNRNLPSGLVLEVNWFGWDFKK